MNRYINSRLIIPFVLIGCSSLPPKTPEITEPPPPSPKYTCLATPSGSYRAGTVIRTVSGAVASAAKIPPDEMTIAYLPLGEPFGAGYADFEQHVSNNANAELTGKVLEKIGIKLDLSGGIAYSIDLIARSNTEFIADDNLRTKTLKKVKDENAIINGARYFFIKEAIGSEDISYIVKQNAAIKGHAQLKSDNSGLSADVKFIDASNNVTGKKKSLIACVVLEEMRQGHAASGEEIMRATLMPANSDDVLRALAITKEK